MSHPCEEMRLLVQADVDGELTPAEAVRVSVHLERCDGCAEEQARLLALSITIREQAPRFPASETLKAALRDRVAGMGPLGFAWPLPASRLGRNLGLRRLASPFAAGFAVAIGLMVLVVPRGEAPAEAVAAAHIRALQPGHLIDVASSDQHTVKPWFDGRLPFAPPVKDLSAVGFPLVGGRLDYLAGHLAAALVYRHGAHDINLFVWPAQGRLDAGPDSESREGYNIRRWTRDGMTFYAVSDLNARDLADFAECWTAS